MKRNSGNVVVQHAQLGLCDLVFRDADLVSPLRVKLDRRGKGANREKLAFDMVLPGVARFFRIAQASLEERL